MTEFDSYSTATEIDNMSCELSDAELNNAIINEFDETDYSNESVDLIETDEKSPWDEAFDGHDSSENAKRAADYARSLGFEKAGDYIERHYEGEDFIPGEPISISTRNMGLEGQTADNGVEFERRNAQLTDGLSVEGVFPKFESKHHVELGEIAKDMSLHQQFNACRENFQDHMYDSPDILSGITFGDMERMELPQGYTPEGYTWQHQPETGSFDLVSKDDHSVGHTGGNALWGESKS